MIDGQLGTFNLKVGQSLVNGERIGQVDDINSYKLQAFIDEFYINQVAIGQEAKFTIADENYLADVHKISTEVLNGQFGVELYFGQSKPENLRRGQTIKLRLSLDDPNSSMLLSAGSYMQDTGGQWLFVLASDGETAFKKMVRVGKKNLEYIEILDGLEVGDKVITSSYQELKTFDNLILED